MKNYKEITLFEGLNPLRFFAAFLVVMHHSETIRKKNGLANFDWLGLFKDGTNAVTFFFVLSGFLITYLLMKENSKTSTISVKKFYLKRVLRIWPLYFLLFVIGTILLPSIFSIMHINYEMHYSFGQVWYYFIFFVPGLVTFYFGHHLLDPLWSIGVEEVFYLIWAPLFKFFKDKILGVLLFILILKILLMIIGLWTPQEGLYNYIMNTFSFEAMAIGGLGAYFVFNRESPISEMKIYSKIMQFGIYMLLGLYMIFHINIDNILWNTMFKVPVISRVFIDFLFLYLIIGVSLADNSIIKLKSKFLSYLGEISYGIYMYHMIMIFAIILFMKKYLINLNIVSGTIVYYLVLTSMVILVSAISKKVFENYFLKMKFNLDKKAL